MQQQMQLRVQQKRMQQIGACQLDVGQHGVIREGVFYPVEPRDFSVLRLLVDNAPNVVKTSTFLRHVWGGKVVGDNVVHQSIGRLRRVLGDDVRNSRYIQTLAKRGYRFVATVAPQSMDMDPTVDLNPIVVLPFKDYSVPATDAYLVDGLCFEICHHLIQSGAQVVNLDCAARDQRHTLSDLVVAARVGARTALSGMLVVAGDRVRVSAQLSDVESGQHLFSAKHDFLRPEILDLHTWLAEALVKEMYMQLSGRKGPRASGASRLARSTMEQTRLGL